MFSGVVAASLVIMHLALLLNLDKWVFVGTAVGIEAISVTLLILLRKRKPQIWLPLVNALASGLAIAWFYVHFGLTPIIWQSICGCFRRGSGGVSYLRSGFGNSRRLPSSWFIRYNFSSYYRRRALIIFIVLVVVTEGDAISGLAPDASPRKKKNK